MKTKEENQNQEPPKNEELKIEKPSGQSVKKSVAKIKRRTEENDWTIEQFKQTLYLHYESKNLKVVSRNSSGIWIYPSDGEDCIYNPEIIFKIAESLKLHVYINVDRSKDSPVPRIAVF